MTRAAVVIALAVGIGGCSLPVIQKRSYNFVSTALFKQPCDATAEPGEYEIALNRCNSRRLLRMIERFMAIEEADHARARPGDTIADVRRKGFSIHIDEDTRTRRPNTRALYGNEALAAAGMAISPPPLQTPEDVKRYADFMSQLYAEEYVERDLASVTDRFCINNRESLEIGEDRIFTILWKDGRVFKRIIKGGPIHHPRQDRALLICPGTFIIDVLSGQLSSAAKALSPVK